MSRKQDKRGRSKKEGRFLKLDHWLMDTDAFRHASAYAQALYGHLKRRYAGPGTNNGKLYLSVREAATLLNCSKSTAAIAFQELIELGFIRVSKPSGFSVKHRAATEYRLTEFTCDVTGELATKEFAKWKPEIQNTVQHMGHTVQHVGQPAPGKRAKAA